MSFNSGGKYNNYIDTLDEEIAATLDTLVKLHDVLVENPICILPKEVSQGFSNFYSIVQKIKEDIQE